MASLRINRLVSSISSVCKGRGELGKTGHGGQIIEHKYQYVSDLYGRAYSTPEFPWVDLGGVGGGGGGGAKRTKQTEQLKTKQYNSVPQDYSD